MNNRTIKISRLRERTDGSFRYWFWCPGCDGAHQFVVGDGDGPRWKFNDSMESPTFTPSLLNTRAGHRCHLFLKDGELDFCKDCDHELAGQKVELPDLPEWLTFKE